LEKKAKKRAESANAELKKEKIISNPNFFFLMKSFFKVWTIKKKFLKKKLKKKRTSTSFRRSS
jgi:hypothetical protein